MLEINGSNWAGIWSDDLLKGIGIEINKDYVYEGEYEDSLKHGVGKCVWVNSGEVNIIIIKNDKSTY